METTATTFAIDQFALGARDAMNRTMHGANRNRDAVLNSLRSGSIHFAAQPILGEGFGAGHSWVEVLARPSYGGVPISPVDLYRYADATGLGPALDAVVVDSVAAWLPTATGVARVAINLTSAALTDPRFLVVDLLATFQVHGISPDRLVFEISETSPIADIGQARAALRCLRDAGASVALDDLGTGYSHWQLAHGGLVDVLKLDRSVWGACTRDAGTQDLRIVKGVAALAKAIDAVLVVEGIESREEADLAADLGSHVYSQGFALGRPIAVPPVRCAQSANFLKVIP